MQLKDKTIKDNLLEDLFRAYYDARRNKRNSKNALEFEVKFEENIFCLFEEIKNRRYRPGPAIAFIVNKPVKREVFASEFRDRVVHHLIFNYINPIFEQLFIEDSYSCRVGKGTSYGIKRVDHFMKSCSQNYSQDCYILKLDIQGFFMSIDRAKLYKKIKETLHAYGNKIEGDLELILYLIEIVVFTDPVCGCIVKSKREEWRGLPKSKSLFYAKRGRGLPIGNLTSQLFANIYLNDFDQFIKRGAKISYYGRYVDDMVFVDRDKNRLKRLVEKVRIFLLAQLDLTLHPKKKYLQNIRRGVSFLGATIRPYRLLVGKRLKGNFYKKIYLYIKQIGIERILASNLLERKKLANKLIAVFNSYLGMMIHFDSYRLREKFTGIICRFYEGLLRTDKGFTKIIPIARQKCGE